MRRWSRRPATSGADRLLRRQVVGGQVVKRIRHSGEGHDRFSFRSDNLSTFKRRAEEVLAELLTNIGANGIADMVSTFQLVVFTLGAEARLQSLNGVPHGEGDGAAFLERNNG